MGVSRESLTVPPEDGNMAHVLRPDDVLCLGHSNTAQCPGEIISPQILAYTDYTRLIVHLLTTRMKK